MHEAYRTREMRMEKPFCQSFRKNPDGTWTSVHQTLVHTPLVSVLVNAGTIFRPGEFFMGVDMVTRLERECLDRMPASSGP